MNSQERLAAARRLESLLGVEHTARLVAEREQRDPGITERRLSYAKQIGEISRRLEEGVLTDRQRNRREWHLAVLQWRVEHGPRIHFGYYDCNFLPEHLARGNPQLKNPA